MTPGVVGGGAPAAAQNTHQGPSGCGTVIMAELGPVAKDPEGFGRVTLLALGWLSVSLGVIGMFLPLLPTTCFLLAAGWCFSRTSRKLERWLYENRLFGRYLTLYRAHRMIPRGVRVASLTVLWTSLGATVLVMRPPGWLMVLLLVVGLSVSAHLLFLETTEVEE
ncbi:MAG: YbaN family protein [Gemmatimonadota bacterium]